MESRLISPIVRVKEQVVCCEVENLFEVSFVQVGPWSLECYLPICGIY